MPDRFVSFGDSQIRYRIIRTGSRRSVGIAVTPAGSVVVRAPKAVSSRTLKKIVRTKAPWIYKKLLNFSELHSSGHAGKEFVSGETFKYLGRGHRLRISHGEFAACSLVNGRFIVAIPPCKSRRKQAAAVRLSLIAWYHPHASKRLNERVAYWSRKMGLRPPRLILCDQRQRWGSCNATGDLRINWRVIQAPLKLVDYVIVHELAHLVYPDHSKSYWKLVKRTLPDFEIRKETLRMTGKDYLW